MLRRSAVVKMCLCTKVVQGLPLLDAIRAAADVGYGAIELFGIRNHLPVDTPDAKVKEAAKLCADLDVEVATICAYLGNFDSIDDAACEKQMDAFRRNLEFANVLDSRWIRVNPTYVGYERTPTPDDVERFAGWARRCADLAAKSGRGICLENNLNMIATLEGTLRTLEAIGRDNVAVSYDPGNIIRADKAHYGRPAVEALMDRIEVLQIKQIDTSLDNLEDPKCFVFYDEGHVDYDEIFRAIAPSKTLRFLSVECHKPPAAGMTEKDVAAREYKLVREHARKYFDGLK
jgi:sugar phosphate isomerase/epimerase